MTLREVLLATRSAGKVRELRPMMQEQGYHVVSLDEAGIAPDPHEDALEVFETFEDNALAKARWFAERSNGRPVIADDSGVEVDALGGRPGVRSKRWSGRPDLDGQPLDDANNAYMLAALRSSGVPEPWSARYVCAAAWVDGDRAIVVRGEADGRMITEPRGAGGFGYDPYFESADYGRTFAETSREEKALVSHRGRAFRALIARVNG
ncbi:MAG: non-canonical purine NTP pyrophosphatase [Gemmatimonas sp.]